jgi:hypothetical protein
MKFTSNFSVFENKMYVLFPIHNKWQGLLNNSKENMKLAKEIDKWIKLNKWGENKTKN